MSGLSLLKRDQRGRGFSLDLIDFPVTKKMLGADEGGDPARSRGSPATAKNRLERQPLDSAQSCPRRASIRTMVRNPSRERVRGSIEATSIDFAWNGRDEMDEVSGDGSAELQLDGLLDGEIYYRNGDEYAFTAAKRTSSTACYPSAACRML